VTGATQHAKLSLVDAGQQFRLQNR
jgi:hypothetical protein